MTPELQGKWKLGLAPFDGTTVASCDDPTLQNLREVLICCVDFLLPSYPTIFLNHDWHEHDGFLTGAESYSWEAFLSVLSSERALFDSRDDDTYVRIAVFPESFEWLIRYNIESDPSKDFSESWSDFDLSASPESAAFQLLDRIRTTWSGYMDSANSMEFFHNSYGG